MPGVFLHDSEKDGSGWPNFRLESAWEYYAAMRLIGYCFEAVYDDIVGGISGKRHQEGIHFKTSKDPAIRKAQHYTNLIEAGTFLALTAYSFVQERASLLKNLKGTVAAELGIDEDKVGLLELRRSKNPLVVSAMDRFLLQASTRSLSDAAFAKGLKWGIISKAFSITLERSAFVDKIAYDRLRTMIEEVQDDNLTYHVKYRLVEGFVNALQRARKDNKMKVMSREELHAIAPVLDRVADKVIEEKIGVPEVVYILGQEVLQPQDVAQSMRNVEIILEKGLKGVAKEKRRQARSEEKVPELKELKEQSPPVLPQEWAPPQLMKDKNVSFAQVITNGKAGDERRYAR